MATFPLWKHVSLGAYYWSTLSRRLHQRWVEERLSRAPVMVLFYHRVADHTPNDWTISNKSFVRQVEWLRRNFDLVSLAEAQRRIRQGNMRSAVSITFDDGYAENCEHALPYLIEQRIPVTYFVASRFALSGEPFPHDYEAGAPLEPNSIEQLRELAHAGVEIGAHSRNHVDFGRVTDERQLRDELLGARDELAVAIEHEVRYFAFPFGLHRNLSQTAFRMAKENGFAGVCSAYGGYNFPGDDAFHLQRIHGDSQLLRLKNWLTVDPRKVAAVQRYELD